MCCLKTAYMSDRLAMNFLLESALLAYLVRQLNLRLIK
jgi:hypothetical protein